MIYKIFSAAQMDFDVHLLSEFLNKTRKEFGESPMHFHAHWLDSYEEEALIVADEPLNEEELQKIHWGYIQETYPDDFKEEVG
jgi:hypothetical protein